MDLFVLIRLTDAAARTLTAGLPEAVVGAFKELAMVRDDRAGFGGKKAALGERRPGLPVVLGLASHRRAEDLDRREVGTEGVQAKPETSRPAL